MRMPVVAAMPTVAGRCGSICGDGLFCPEFEACDDGFTDSAALVTRVTVPQSEMEQRVVMGQSVPKLEFCDDGYNDTCGTCNSDCTGPGGPSVCGDGVVCESELRL